MNNIFIKDGNLTRFFALFLSVFGLTVTYLAIFYIEDKLLKFFVTFFGLFVGSLGGFSSKARAFNLKPFAKFSKSDKHMNDDEDNP